MAPIDALPVLGYHGTSQAAAAQILDTGFVPSANEYDWLGDGVYFFQDGPARALEWARAQHGDDAAVLRVEIDLRDCLDLLDLGWYSVLNQAHDDYIRQCRLANIPIPGQTLGAHRLDRHVINYVCTALLDKGTVIRSVRGAYVEGAPAFPNSFLFGLSHVQIAVRDPECISSVTLEVVPSD